MAEIITVKDLERFEDGETVALDAAIKMSNRKVATNGSPYMDITLADNEKDVSCKIWSVSEAVETFIKGNEYIRVVAKVGVYRGSKQLVINRCLPIPEDELDIQKLKKTAPISVAGMIQYIEGIIDGIEDKAIQFIVKTRFEENKVNFSQWVAARSHHHNYESGLIYHTTSMLRLAQNNVSQYPGKLDSDIVYGAIILHDMDKVREYTPLPDVNFTELGSLYGHIFMSGAETYAIAKKLEQEKPELDMTKIPFLIHAILAHHGKLEWGSPVVPQTIEAEIVHQIDMMDSRMNSEYKK